MVLRWKQKTKGNEVSDELTVVNPGELYRQATDVAGVCKDIVLSKAIEIQGRRYVPVEPWMAIATAHGCVASSKNVERVEGNADTAGGFKAIGEIRKISDGALVATAEGFVGEDEPTWWGGETEAWDKQTRKYVKKTLKKRPDFAIRAMCQTRAISRACRSAFAHVVVLIDKNLSTVPAEEMMHEDEQFGAQAEPIKNANAKKESKGENENTEEPQPEKPEAEKRWQDYVCSYGKKDGELRGKKLGSLTTANLRFLYNKFTAEGLVESELSKDDQEMLVGLKKWAGFKSGEQS
jgi:hypothetical protein